MLISQIQNDAKKPWKWLKPSETLQMVYSARAIQLRPTKQGLEGFQKYVCPYAVDEHIHAYIHYYNLCVCNGIIDENPPKMEISRPYTKQFDS